MSDTDNTTPATEPGTVATPLTVRDIVPISSFEQLPDIHDDDVLVVQDVSVPAYRKLTIRRLLEWLTIGFRQMAFDSAHPAYDPDTGYGDIYIQYPQAYDMDTHTIQYNAPEPAQLYNRNGITSTWVELDYDGAFFRSNGGFAQNFDEQTTPQSDDVKPHTHGVTDPGHSHSIIDDTVKNAVGSFYSSAGGSYYFRLARDGTTNSGTLVAATGTTHITIKNSTGAETRPTNYTIRIWLRTA